MDINLPSRLPKEYQEVEWIESSGTQYLLIDYTPVVGDMIDTRFIMRNDGAIFSAGTGTYQFIILAQNWQVYLKYFSSGSASALSFSYDVKRTIRFSSTGLITETNEETGVTRTLDTEVSKTKSSVNTKLYIFKRADGTNICSARLYGFNISGKIDLVPCYRKSDNEIGMYDIVNGVFYTNQGTGTFTKGNDVIGTDEWIIPEGDVAKITDPNNNVLWTRLPSEYQEVAWIDGQGKARILSELPFNSMYTIKARFEVVENTADSYLCGWYRVVGGNIYRIYFIQSISGIAQNKQTVRTFGYPFGTGNIWHFDYGDTIDYEVSGEYRYAKCDKGTFNATNATEYTDSAKMYFFGQQNNSSWKGKVYKISVEYNNELLAYFVPCKKLSNNEYGMFDLVSRKFYGSVDAGAFTGGQPI